MLKLLLRSLLVILVLTVSLIGAGWLWLRTSLPKLDGTLALPGLDAPVEIVRDANAIPHVYAETDHDLFMAVGFVHAQDRLWQMHLQRSIAAGRLTELVGARRDENGESDNVDTDKFLRTMGIYRAAEEAWNHISPETKENLESYAAGVNAYLSTRRGALPPEFLAVGVNDIREWSPIDSLAWLKMMMWDLGGNRSTELMNFVLSSVVSSKDLATLNGTYPGDETFVLPDLNQLYGRKPMSAMAFRRTTSRCLALSFRPTRASGPIIGLPPVIEQRAVSHCWRTTPTWASVRPRFGTMWACIQRKRITAPWALACLAFPTWFWVAQIKPPGGSPMWVQMYRTISLSGSTQKTRLNMKRPMA